MSPKSERAVLSREELDALLESVADSRAAKTEPSGEPEAPSPLDRGLDDFAAEQSRALSTQYQRGIRFVPMGRERLSHAQFSEALLGQDRLLRLPLAGGEQQILMLIGRSLLYSWLTLAFGGAKGNAGVLVPEREYTRIELRFMRRVALELARQMTSSLGLPEVDESGFETLDRAMIPAGDDTEVEMASFDVQGFGDMCRLRVGLPGSLGSPRRGDAPSETRLTGPMLDAAVSLKVEAGTIELSLGRLARLQAGDLFPVEPAHREGLVVRVEDEPRFRAIRGAVGDRLAVQLQGRL